MNTLNQYWPSIAIVVIMVWFGLWLIYDIRKEYKEMRKQDKINLANLDNADLTRRNEVRTDQSRRNLRDKYKVKS